MKPLIGMTPTPELLKMEHGTFRRHTLSDHYSKAVEAAGGIPVMLPAHFELVEEMLDHLNALVITGGGDIDPTKYGQEAHEKTGDLDEERDRFEQAMFHAASKRDMPVMGICRGLQMFNVALGGTLYQDVADLVPGSDNHRQQDDEIHHEEPSQTVTIAEGNHPLSEISSSGELEVNSFHHQSIDELADDLVAIAHTRDGIVEAVYNPDMTFGLAVQWHPELMAHKQAEQARIFELLVDAAAAYSTRKAEVPETV